ncbi:MAG TPA: hypothetical protein VFZ10_12880 [Geminicoccaceae bacterium]
MAFVPPVIDKETQQIDCDNEMNESSSGDTRAQVSRRVLGLPGRAGTGTLRPAATGASHNA